MSWVDGERSAGLKRHGHGSVHAASVAVLRYARDTLGGVTRKTVMVVAKVDWEDFLFLVLWRWNNDLNTSSVRVGDVLSGSSAIFDSRVILAVSARASRLQTDGYSDFVLE